MDPGNTAEAGALSSTWREAWAAASGKREILGLAVVSIQVDVIGAWTMTKVAFV